MQNVNSKQQQKVYNVLVQGWGDDEEQFYSCGVYNTHIKAMQRMQQLLDEWEENGGERNDVVWDIEAQFVA